MISPIAHVDVVGNLIASNTSAIVFDVAIENGRSSNGNFSVTGDIYANGDLRFVIDAHGIQTGTHTLYLFQYDGRIIGSWNLIAEIVSLKRSICNAQATEDRTRSNRYDVQLTIQCADALQSSSTMSTSTIAGIIAGMIGFIIIVAVIVVVILVIRRKNRGDEMEIEMKRKFVLDDVVLGREIGSGAFGKVFQGRWLQTEVACKSIKKEQRHMIQGEIDILTSVRHPNIVQYFGLHERDDECYMVMEFMRDGDLLSALIGRKISKFAAMKDVIAQCAAGMLHLAEKNILHRDLAARNVLVRFIQNESYEIKISDFGMSRIASGDPAPITEKFPVRWVPAEVLEDRRFTEQSDVWSFGILMWEVFTQGQVPYGRLTSNQDVMSAILELEHPQVPSHMPEDMKSLMLSCWNEEGKRPTFRDITSALGQVAME
eukprot:TRINITY_DN5828_c1_g1_i3.p1 TRINITY_DN5828_c1_g1~~TRINITY_DN5828_c1_g1_i3.p1  ORF type:complete len:430 (-),score=114.88 TRINITY_DN5828_c1_g1_i3:174-1463(-)